METISISAITWNVQTGWPEQDLGVLLGVTTDTGVQSANINDLPDLYFICLQEVKSQPQNVVMDTLFEEPWTTAVRDILSPRNYVKVSGERLQGLVTSLFVKRHHLPHIRDILTAVTRTGFAGLWGNKGACCVRFSLYGCSICVVNSHLAPHDSGYKDRCEMYNTIVDTTIFNIPETSNILYHDYVFWLGDQNFRLDQGIAAETIAKKVDADDLKTLITLDELHRAQKAGDAFAQLTEGDLTFPPTYKYGTGKTSYDLARRPAWTDRILYQVHVDAYENLKLSVEQTRYTDVRNYTQSDHKPVVADYKIKVFANHEERCVHFQPVSEWVVGEGGKVLYTTDADVQPSPWDYIALYKADFSCVHQYITYTYAPQAPVITTPNTYMVLFNDELVQDPGEYVLLYYSGKYSCYLAMSQTFPIVQKPDQ